MNKLETLKKTAVYAKYLFMHGCSHASAHDPIHRMIALHDMHNAVEWLLGGLWTYYYEDQDKPWTFRELFNQISKKQKLILVREIEMLNQARNQVQHHAVQPDPEALNKYMQYCEIFFRETLRGAHPELEYDEIFMGILVPDMPFRLQSDIADEEYAKLMGGTIESTRDLPDPEQQRPCVALNLRTIMIQAERFMTVAMSNQGNQQTSAVSTMVVLGSCLAYAQLLAIQALQGVSYPRFPSTFYSPDGEVFDPYSLDLTPVRVIGRGIVGQELGLLPALHSLSSVKPHGFLADYEDIVDEILIPFIENLSLALRNVLEKLSLGIDTKQLWRFQKLFQLVTGSSPGQVNDSDLLWCHDFVLTTVLEFSPVIREIVTEDYTITLDEFYGMRADRAGAYDFGEDSPPF